MAARQQQRRPQTETKPTPQPAAAEKAAPKKPKPPPPPPQGLYPELGIKDETGSFGALGSGARSGGVRGIVEHRTESSSMESARNSYRTMIKEGRHIGAHYLIGPGGETSLTVPTDSTPAHVRGNKDASWKGANDWAIGIENVGLQKKLDPKKDAREQITALNLPPGMKSRLLALDDKALAAKVFADDAEMHQDITGAQKRANWNLVNRLVTEHHLDPATQVVAHEQVDEKTPGEGEPIIEFLAAMRQWPVKVETLEAKLAKLAADPSVKPEQLQAAQRALAQGKAAMAAVAVDKTSAENNALEAEGMLGEPGAATEREQQRTEFYDQFWDRTQQIDKLNAD